MFIFYSIVNIINLKKNNIILNMVWWKFSRLLLYICICFIIYNFKYLKFLFNILILFVNYGVCFKIGM